MKEDKNKMNWGRIPSSLLSIHKEVYLPPGLLIRYPYVSFWSYKNEARRYYPCNFNLFHDGNITWLGEESGCWIRWQIIYSISCATNKLCTWMQTCCSLSLQLLIEPFQVSTEWLQDLRRKSESTCALCWALKLALPSLTCRPRLGRPTYLLAKHWKGSRRSKESSQEKNNCSSLHKNTTEYPQSYAV